MCIQGNENVNIRNRGLDIGALDKAECKYWEMGAENEDIEGLECGYSGAQKVNNERWEFKMEILGLEMWIQEVENTDIGN